MVLDLYPLVNHYGENYINSSKWNETQFDEDGRAEMKIALHFLHFSIYCTLPHNIYPSRELFIPSYTWSQLS